MCESGPCFVVVSGYDIGNRERLFHLGRFDPAEFTQISREELFQSLVKREAKRVKAEQIKERARDTARLNKARAESDAEDERLPWEYEPEDPLQPIEQEAEIIAAEDSEGHESLNEPEEETDEELILEED